MTQEGRAQGASVIKGKAGHSLETQSPRPYGYGWWCRVLESVECLVDEQGCIANPGGKRPRPHLPGKSAHAKGKRLP